MSEIAGGARSSKGVTVEELFRFAVVRPPRSGSGFVVPLHRDGSVLERLLLQAGDPASRRRTAATYRSEHTVLWKLDELPYRKELEAFATALEKIRGGDERAAVGAALMNAVGSIPVVDFLRQADTLRDTFLSFVLAPDPNRPSLAAIARYLRALHIGLLYQNQAPELSAPRVVEGLLAAPLLLPDVALATQARRPWPVGFADLLVVKQHILRYEGGEVARIENILRGETRKHGIKHTLSTDRERTIETERTEETSEERSTTERTKLSAEVQRELKEQWHVKAGLDVGYGKEPSFFIRANAGFSYDRMTDESSKFATELAKDVTTKAASRVSERIRNVERVRVIETFEDNQEQAFQNVGDEHVAGVYQFIDKVYRCRTYSYGKRWLMDFVIPEPAAYLLSARKAIAQSKSSPKPPPALTDNGNDVEAASDPGTPVRPSSPLEAETIPDPADPTKVVPNPMHYATLAARYGVTGMEPPPAPTVEVSKALSLKKTEDYLIHAETIRIPDGYVARHVMTFGNWHGEATSDINIFVGDLSMGFSTDAAVGAGPFHRELALQGGADKIGPIGDSVPISISGHNSDAVAFNLVISCALTPQALQAWRIRTFDRIAARYEQLRRDYEDKLAAQTFLQADSGKLGRSPEQNRIVERLEIKKFALSVLEGAPYGGFDQIANPPPPPPPTPLPAPDVTSATFEDDMARVRFLEQAFEWENMSYVLYPYFHGRQAHWKESLARVEDDPQFESFLRAGAARVVIAIRPGFAEDVFHFLATGLVWSGADVPVIGDPRYTPIVEELRQQAGAGAPGEPYGTDWELRLATDLVKLRRDDSLPAWNEIDPAAQPKEPRTWVWAERKNS